ncbi:hypothetical protein NZ35_25430 [Pseudomonas chlororaphis]|uniref:Uncharacterized protein n=1 Tax=Pseudomonas chlororaphis TaxID=587753 RepID=A0A0A6D5M0_9PSED|nr:hypothetical protein NZ35_25430 [Pseudomonas chlororaphis]
MSNAYSGKSKVRSLGKRPEGALTEPAPIIQGILEDGTLPIELIPIGTALKVQIPSWSGRLDTDEYDFRILKDVAPTDPLNDGDILEDNPAGPANGLPVDVEVPSGPWLVDDPAVPGPSTYYVWAVIYLAGINPIETFPTKYVVDRFAPGQNESTNVKAQLKVMTWPAAWAGPITDKLIADHPAGLVMQVDRTYVNPLDPPYGDNFEVWMSSNYSAVPPFPPIIRGMLPADGSVTIPIAEVAKLKGDTVYIWCRLTDFAHNVSNMSIPAGKSVALLPPPVLADITVPKADPVITIEDAAAGVTAEFARGTDVQNDDLYVVYYDDLLIYDDIAGSETSYSVPILKSDLAKKYDDAAGSDQQITVTCALARGPLPVGTPKTVDVLVNFEYAGPTNPGHPDPVNTAMNKLKVFGVLDKPDELTPEDFEKDCRIEIELWNEVGRQPQDGQEVKVYVGGKFVPPAIFLQNGDEGKTKVHTLPWDVIKDVTPGGSFDAYWTVTTIGSVNIPRSEETEVTFGAIKIELAAPEVRGTRGGRLGCPSTSGADRGITVFVKSDPVYLPVDTEVMIYFKGYSDFPGVTPNPAANPFMVKHEVLDTEVDTGFEVRITPFNPVLKYSTAEPNESVPGTYSGAAEVWYEVTIGGAPSPTKSLVSSYEVILIASGFVYCDGSKYDDDKP